MGLLELVLFFFFQAEDGIRDWSVTGVQTCALPILVSSNSRPAEVTWNYDRVELIADGIVHAIGVSLGLAGAIAIVVVAANSQHNTELSSIVVYSVGLLSMFGFSAAYNTWPVSPAKRVLRRFDHSAIFLMIAGTYTPFIAHIKGNLVAMGLLTGVWLTAVVGIILKLLLPRRFDRLAVVLYLLLGWSGAFVYEPVVAALPRVGRLPLAAGGTPFSIGVGLFALGAFRIAKAVL